MSRLGSHWDSCFLSFTAVPNSISMDKDSCYRRFIKDMCWNRRLEGTYVCCCPIVHAIGGSAADYYCLSSFPNPWNGVRFGNVGRDRKGKVVRLTLSKGQRFVMVAMEPWLATHSQIQEVVEDTLSSPAFSYVKENAVLTTINHSWAMRLMVYGRKRTS